MWNRCQEVAICTTAPYKLNETEEKKSRYYETKEELNALKEEVEALNKKLAELTEDELAQVAGGLIPDNPADFELKSPLAEPLSFEPESFTPKNLVFVKTDVQ